MNLAEKIPLRLVIIVALAVAPFVVAPFTITLLNHIGIGALVALGLVLLTGVGGITSFGQAAFVGIAAYTTAWMTAKLGLSPWLGLAAGIALTTVSAAFIGLITLRLGGHFLSLSTIAWGISIYYLFGNIEALGRHTGLSGIPPVTVGPWLLQSASSIYYLIWASVLAAAIFSANLLDSRMGRAIRLLRGGNLLMSSVGMDIFRVRLVLFIIAAILAGLAGWLYAHTMRFVSPTPFDVRGSIDYLLMAIVGGATHVLGAAIGAGVVVFFRDWLQDLLPLVSKHASQIETIVFSFLLIVLLHKFSTGLAPSLMRFVKTGASKPVDMTSAALPHREMSARGTPMLSVQDVERSFGGLRAVNKVSFDIAAGEIVGLIGPNGAGKSTMFNLITGAIPVSGGRVQFLGRDVTAQSQRAIAALGCARTFQHTKLRPHMSLIDNVAAGTFLRTKSGYLDAGLSLNAKEEASVKAEAMRRLEQVGLADRAWDLAGDLPLGQQRVLEIARALATDPVLLILDEPAAGLRSNEKTLLAQLLNQLRDEGLTILIVEHDMGFVMSLVDRVIVMVFGEKIFEGTPAEARNSAAVQTAYLGSGADK